MHYQVLLTLAAVITSTTARSIDIQKRNSLTSRMVAPIEWNYHGCWTDQGDRQLGGASYTADDMTPSTCISYCDARGYSFAGVEYSRECFCGYALKAQSTLKDDSECNMACAGDETKSCGGPNRLNVYTSGAATQIVTNPGPVGSGWAYKSCYEDSVYARTLNYKVDTPGGNSVASCTTACKAAGYKYAGVEWSSECWCDNSINFDRASGLEGCDMVCDADKMEYCGGSQRLNLYEFEAVVSSTSSSATTTTSDVSSTTSETSSTTSSSASSISDAASSTSTSTTTSEVSSTTSSSTTSSVTSTTLATSTTTSVATTTTTTTTPVPTTSSTTTAITTTTTTTTTPASIPTFAIRAGGSTNPTANGQRVRVYNTGSTWALFVAGPTAATGLDTSLWKDGKFTIEAGTNRLKSENNYILQLNSNRILYSYNLPTRAGMSPVICPGPIVTGQKLNCRTEQGMVSQWRTDNRVNANHYAQLDNPSSSLNGQVVLDWVVEAVA